MLLAAVLIFGMLQQWPHRHDDLAIARWMAWFIMVISVLILPRVLVVAVFGRLPRVYARMPAKWNKTLPQVHADLAREQQEQRERSREF
ncbi:MAG: hypothetical protein ABI178_09980 [Rhodanobacter sp.]